MMRLYSLEPLAVLAGVKPTQLARRLRVSGSTWRQYQEEGVSEKVADRMACRLGFDPYVVWPEMLDHAIEDMSSRCVGCGELFMPSRKGHIYCSKACNNIVAVRRYKATPVGAERNREARRRYYWKYHTYELGQKALRDARRRAERAAA